MGSLEHINILRRCYTRDEAACWYQRLGALRVLEECDVRRSQERAPHFRYSSCVEFIVVSPFPYREQDLSSFFIFLSTVRLSPAARTIMKSILALTLLSATTVYCQSAIYEQCGGQLWTGATTCADGTTCQVQNSCMTSPEILRFGSYSCQLPS